MGNLKEKVDEFVGLLQKNKFIEAVEKFYGDDIVSHENEDPPIIGFKKYLETETDFFNHSKNVTARLKQVVISGDISVLVIHYHFEHDKYGIIDQEQVSVQRWKNGKIIHERHHYKTDKW